MMNTRLYTIILAIISMMIPMKSMVAATSPQERSGMPQSTMTKNQDGMMDMSVMMQEPHHQLAMAYKQNLESFAKALRDEAAKTATVNPEFARAAVAEMKRSFDLMQQHHQDHMKTIDDKMKAHMSNMMKQMEAQDAAIKEALAGLDKEVQNSAPDSKAISQYVDDILKNCDMSKMHGEMMKDPMAQPTDHKMN
jgi:polyhydroxyalkanoate synthesis regulator phasin